MSKYRALILGGIWMPYGIECSLETTFNANTDAEAVEAAQTTQAGDFSSVRDVQVMRYANQRLHLYPTIMVKDWDTEDTEMAYYDTLTTEE